MEALGCGFALSEKSMDLTLVFSLALVFGSTLIASIA